VNGHRLKPFVEKEVKLVDPIYKDEWHEENFV
jgi:hypothetical protein